MSTNTRKRGREDEDAVTAPTSPTSSPGVLPPSSPPIDGLGFHDFEDEDEIDENEIQDLDVDDLDDMAEDEDGIDLMADAER